MPGWIAIDQKVRPGKDSNAHREARLDSRAAGSVQSAFTIPNRSRENSKRDATRRKYGRRIKIYDTKLPQRVTENDDARCFDQCAALSAGRFRQGAGARASYPRDCNGPRGGHLQEPRSVARDGRLPDYLLLEVRYRWAAIKDHLDAAIDLARETINAAREGLV